MHSAAALLQQSDDVLIFNLLMHLELLKGCTQGLEEGTEVIVVGEVGFRQLWIPKENIQKKVSVLLLRTLYIYIKKVLIT